jgi:hypothetical protein
LADFIGIATDNIIARSPIVTPGPSSCELWRTLMYRMGENPDTSQWGPAALHYLNRAYWALCRGGGEFEEGGHEDWPWLRKVPPGVLILEPERSTLADGSTVSVVRGSQTIGLSVAPAVSCLSWQFRVLSDVSPGDIFRVVSHAPGQATMLLDAPYTGSTSTTARYWLRQFDYPLAADVLHLIEPLHTDRCAPDAEEPYTIRLTSDVGLSEQWSHNDWSSGVPTQCALIGVQLRPDVLATPLAPAGVGTQLLRFNRCANASTGPIRVEYPYTFLPMPLTQMTGVCDEVPVCPPTLRWSLVDLALYYAYFDKNDTRADGAVILGKGGLRFAQREQRHQMAVTGTGVGRLRTREYARGAWSRGRPLYVTASGPAGVPGPQGIPGPPGPQGQSTQWYSGVGPPSSTLGHSGDFYLDTATGDVYALEPTGWLRR